MFKPRSTKAKTFNFLLLKKGTWQPVVDTDK